jgi:hypothetical protein
VLGAGRHEPAVAAGFGEGLEAEGDLVGDGGRVGAVEAGGLLGAESFLPGDGPGVSAVAEAPDDGQGEDEGQDGGHEAAPNRSS